MATLINAISGKIVAYSTGVSIAKNANANIATGVNGGQFYVRGNGSANVFNDVIVCQASGNVSVLGAAVYGTPPTRTYSMSGTTLNLALANNGNSDTFGIVAVGFGW